MVCVSRPHPVKLRYMFRYMGIGLGTKFGVHLNSSGNIRRALMERVYNIEGPGGLTPTPKPVPGHINKVLSRFSACLSKYITPALPLTDDEFVQRYHGRRKMVYQKAVESLRAQGVTARDARLKMFVKAEKLNLSAKPDPAPRAIQPRDPRFNASLGQYISHLEKPLFKAIAKVFGAPTVIKGYDAKQSGDIITKAWESFKKPVAFGLDASRFDQHVSDEALMWEHEQWLKFYRSKKDKLQLAKLLSMQIDNVGFAYAPDCKVRYKVKGCRMSGDMNTSSGNCLIMCALVHAFCSDVGIGKFRLLNNGDDCSLIMEQADEIKVSSLKDWFLKCGFTMKMEAPVYNLEGIDFCQTHVVRLADGPRCIRDPRIAMAKDLTGNCRLDLPNVRKAWLDSVRTGGLALTDGCPMWGKFYEMFPASDAKKTQELDALHESGWTHLRGKLKYQGNPITPESRYSFWLAFGILPDAQTEIENHFGTINLGDHSLDVSSHHGHYGEPHLPM